MLSTNNLIKDCTLKTQKEYIKNAQDAAQAYQDFEIDHEREHLMALFLNTRKRIIKKEILFIGAVDESLISPHTIFRKALLYNASAVILAHNHPTGDTSPSSQDISITIELAKSGQLLNITLLDHLILNNQGEYYSLSDKALF